MAEAFSDGDGSNRGTFQVAFAFSALEEEQHEEEDDINNEEKSSVAAVSSSSTRCIVAVRYLRVVTHQVSSVILCRNISPWHSDDEISFQIGVSPDPGTVSSSIDPEATCSSLLHKVWVCVLSLDSRNIKYNSVREDIHGFRTSLIHCFFNACMSIEMQILWIACTIRSF